MTLTVMSELAQGSDEWLAARLGVLTASVIGQLITPKTVKPASNDTSRALTMHLTAERITGWSEPTWVTADMERGNRDEPIARDLYTQHFAPVAEVGFMVLEQGGIKLGYSPDGLVGDDGLIEIKSRRQKVQLATILADAVPLDNLAQCQAGLLVSGREWLDYISFSGGMPLFIKRVYPDTRWFQTILAAAEQFEAASAEMVATYTARTSGLPATERVLDLEEIRI